MLSLFIDSSVDNILLQSPENILEFIGVPKRRPIDSLLHDTANIVSKQTEVRVVGPQIRRDEIY